MKAVGFEFFKKFPGLLPMLRPRFMGHKDPIMRILHHPHTLVRSQRVVAVNMTRRRWREGTPLLQHLLWRGHMRAKVIHPSFDRRRGHGNQEQRGEEKRHVPETRVSKIT